MNFQGSDAKVRRNKIYQNYLDPFCLENFYNEYSPYFLLEQKVASRNLSGSRLHKLQQKSAQSQANAMNSAR